MFKYKSPLSRLLEGAGKTKEAEETPSETAAATPAPTEGKQEPIADFNALRAALAGGNMTSESYEETDELIPENKMPDFDEAEPEVETVQEDSPEDESLFAEETTDESDEPVEESITEAPTEEATEGEQIVTLHLSPEVEVSVAPSEPSPEPVIATAEPEPLITENTPDPVAEAPVPAVEPTEALPQSSAPAVTPAEDRRSRVKTTFLGFERADTHVQDLMETADPVAKTEATEQTFPVGWLVVTSGPGRGASITLSEGLMQIGRNDDQAIQLDFGDTGISRSNHAVIAYDPEDRKCYLGHGGKANLVRLNGKPVLSTVALSNGDEIRISETTIRFAAFCDEGFDWRDS